MGSGQCSASGAVCSHYTSPPHPCPPSALTPQFLHFPRNISLTMIPAFTLFEMKFYFYFSRFCLRGHVPRALGSQSSCCRLFAALTCVSRCFEVVSPSHLYASSSIQPASKEKFLPFIGLASYVICFSSPPSSSSLIKPASSCVSLLSAAHLPFSVYSVGCISSCDASPGRGMRRKDERGRDGLSSPPSPFIPAPAVADSKRMQNPDCYLHPSWEG